MTLKSWILCFVGLAGVLLLQRSFLCLVKPCPRVKRVSAVNVAILGIINIPAAHISWRMDSLCSWIYKQTLLDINSKLYMENPNVRLDLTSSDLETKIQGYPYFNLVLRKESWQILLLNCNRRIHKYTIWQQLYYIWPYVRLFGLLKVKYKVPIVHLGIYEPLSSLTAFNENSCT